MKNFCSAFIFASLALTACNNTQQNNKQESKNDSTKSETMGIPDAKKFQETIDGKQTDLYVLKNKDLRVAITNYGARVVSLLMPDKNGNITDVSVGFDNIDDYTKGGDTYFGAVVGRYGNRIAKGKFKLDGKEYTLATNNAPNHLHGGNKGFSRVVWDVQQPEDSTLILIYISPDAEEGYPGELNAQVTYILTSNNELKIVYEATTDKPTVVNLTNHTYFNLNGEGSGSINNHLMMINANKFTPVDSTLIPTGKLENVANTPFDFRKPTAIGERINDTNNIQLKYGKGYDHNFVLNKSGGGLTKAAEVVGDQSGIVMDVYTTEPGIQFYGGNFMNGTHKLKSGKTDDYRTAFCLETQHYPDSPNQPNFPSTTLEPGKVYKTTTVYAFSVKK